MTKIQFNNQGVPLMAYGDKTFVTTTGAPKTSTKNNAVEKRPDASKSILYIDDTTSVKEYTLSSWGDVNDFPTKSNDIIKRVGVLNTGLKFTRNFTMGQGIFPTRVIGYESNGSEILEVINDNELINFCQGRMVRRYLEKVLRDYLKFSCANVHLIPDSEGKTISGIEVINALYSRYTVAKNGIIEKCIVSGRFPDFSGVEFEAFDLLDDFDPYADLDRRRMGGKVKGKSFVFAIKDSWSNNDYYPEPAWHSAYLAGWVDIAMVVPKFLKKAYENQINWKWHVQIPYAFWDKKFPEADYKDAASRQVAIQEYMDSLETNLCGTENADKPIFTFFEINPNNGKVEEQWIINPLDNKYKEGDKLVTSVAANSEILFSLMINPNVLGAGMPGGTYAGNQGGSNIREAFLINIANAWLDRQNILDPLETMLQYNGVKDVQLRFGNTILTTLDTGSGTKKHSHNMFLKTIDDIREVLKISSSVDFEVLRPVLETVDREFLRPVLGAAMHDKLQEFYDSSPDEIYIQDSDPAPVPSAEEIAKAMSRILKFAQSAEIHLAYWYGLDLLNIQIMNDGFKRTESEKVKGLFKYQEDNLKEFFKHAGFNGLDAMLEYIDGNDKLCFPEFHESETGKQLKEMFIPRTDVFDQFYDIGSSRLLFLRLKAHMKVVEDLRIKIILGNTNFNFLKAK